MIDQRGAQTNELFQEAPASWNTRYIDPTGFECQLTLRNSSGSDLLKKAAIALKALTDAGCTPALNIQLPNGLHKEQPSIVVCELHNAEMKRREKNGQIWYSHKLADGTYCNGKKVK